MQYDPKKIEKSVQDIWKKNRIPEKIVDFKANLKMRKKFYLLDGPPYANALPHVGHVKTTTFKDVWGKFKFMQGFAVWFQPGFDCGGLPIENAVEKKLGIKSKSDIEKIGVDFFIRECKKFAEMNVKMWLDLYKKIAAWRGWLEPYLTSANYYKESGWWTIKKLYEEGFFVEGFKPGFWCPKCETVLSGYEVSDSYKNLEDPSIFVKFKVKRKNEFLLAWTTTPWTLPANVALCVHPDEYYVKVEVNGEKLILAEKRLTIFEELELGFKIIEKMKGKDLEGLKYEPLLDVPLQRKLEENENAHQVIVSVPILKKKVSGKVAAKKKISGKSEFEHVVDMETGSGIVHIAPGHGDVDNQLGKHYNLPEPSPVDEKGRLTKDAGQFSGLFVKDADQIIIDYLKERGLLLHAGKIVHSYPLCWRCKSPLIYRMSKQWFLKIGMIRDKMIKENKAVRWLPEFARERFHNLLEEAPDWAITRQRYWGIPLPIWVCEKCGSKKVVGSRDELRKLTNQKLPKDFEISKDVVDKIELKCDCGGKMRRLPDIMDVWFDSGIAPWASLGYPFKNKELYEKLKPVDLIDESQDQIRGWFYTLMFCGVATFNERPYETVCLNGWTIDEKGEKMSKSLGNVILAEDAYNELGADLMRLYYCYDIAPWETQKFSMKNAKELGRSLNILWNVYNYFKTYCQLQNKIQKNKLRVEDKWILSKLNSLIKSSTENLENFRFHLVGREIVNFFVNDLSRTYIKLIRGRQDEAVNYTLTECLDVICRLLAPITPFISEFIYYDLFEKSVHLSKWPKHDENMIDKSLEEDMKIVEEVANLSNHLRKENHIKLRWPLPLLVVDAKMRNNLKDILKNLCNVKNVEFGKKKGLKHAKSDLCSIYLDINVIEDEALLRELLREIQATRKKEGLTVNEKIVLYIDNEEMKKFENVIKEKVGAEKIVFQKIEKPIGKARFKNKIVNFYFETV